MPHTPLTEDNAFKIVQDARDNRYQQKRDTLGNAAPRRSNPQGLVGECDQNAVELARLCAKENWDPVIVCGGYDYPGERTPESFAEAKMDQTVHYWVEVPNPNEGNRLVLDVSKEGRPNLGHPLAQTSRPSGYITFPDSTIAYQNDLTAEKLRNMSAPV